MTRSRSSRTIRAISRLFKYIGNTLKCANSIPKVQTKSQNMMHLCISTYWANQTTITLSLFSKV